MKTADNQQPLGISENYQKVSATLKPHNIFNNDLTQSFDQQHHSLSVNNLNKICQSVAWQSFRKRHGI